MNNNNDKPTKDITLAVFIDLSKPFVTVPYLKNLTSMAYGEKLIVGSIAILPKENSIQQ